MDNFRLKDNFREEVVTKRNRTLDNILYALSWVGIVLFGLIALMGLAPLLSLQFDVLSVLMFVVFGGAAFLLWRNKDTLRTEYEYSLTNSDLDVSRVLANVRRKYLTAVSLKSVEAAGPVSGSNFQRYLSMKVVKKHNWFLNRDGNLIYFYFTKSSVKHLMVLEPSDTMIELIKRQLQRGVWQE